MLPRSKRLGVALFANAMANGKIVHSPLFTARILKTAGPSRFSAAISKKIAKTAVERNKIRRRIYSGIGKFENRLQEGYHVVLLGKNTVIKADLKAISDDLENLFVKSGLIK